MPFTLLTNRFKRDSFQHFDSFEKRKHQSAYKPGSVHMVSHVGWPFIWSLCCHKLRATNPGSKSESTPTSQDVMPPLFGFAPGGVCLAKPCCQGRGALLPHLFTLACFRSRRFVSVALSLGLPPPGVTRHPNPVEPGLSSPAALSSQPFRAVRRRPSSRLVWRG